MNSKFIEAENLRRQIAEAEAQLKQIEQDNFNPYGVWEVTTEGDCEGRSTKRLGRHEGNIFDIAKSLGSQSFYSLNFKRVGYLDVALINQPKKQKDVHITINDNGKRIDDITKIMKSAPEDVIVGQSNYHSCVKITYNK